MDNKIDALIYVIDAQEDLRKSTITDICTLYDKIKQKNENVFLELFVHKVDGDPFSSEDIRVEIQQNIQTQIMQEINPSQQDVVTIHLTSCYNPSIFEAWSLVLQKLIPNQIYIVELLDNLVELCKMEKAFLFDMKTRLYLATDHNPVDHQTLTLCSDSIDLQIGFESVYGHQQTSNNMMIAPSDAATEPIQSSSSSLDTSVKVKLSNNMVLFNKQVDRNLVLVCVARKESWVDPWLIERNVSLFKDALLEIKAEINHLQQQEE
jgi:Ras-related GTP-binding protein C/D